MQLVLPIGNRPDQSSSRENNSIEFADNGWSRNTVETDDLTSRYRYGCRGRRVSCRGKFHLARERQETCADVVRDFVRPRARRKPLIYISTWVRDIETILSSAFSRPFRRLMFQISWKSVENSRSYSDFLESRFDVHSPKGYRYFAENIDSDVSCVTFSSSITSRVKYIRKAIDS